MLAVARILFALTIASAILAAALIGSFDDRRTATPETTSPVERVGPTEWRARLSGSDWNAERGMPLVRWSGAPDAFVAAAANGRLDVRVITAGVEGREVRRLFDGADAEGRRGVGAAHEREIDLASVILLDAETVDVTVRARDEFATRAEATGTFRAFGPRDAILREAASVSEFLRNAVLVVVLVLAILTASAYAAARRRGTDEQKEFACCFCGRAIELGASRAIVVVESTGGGSQELHGHATCLRAKVPASVPMLDDA